jgi:hypothetical protein
MSWDEKARLVAEQNASYRRGVVLGLTMAEAGILIIFVLLLLIGFNEWIKAMDQEAARDKVLIEKSRVAQLEEKESQLAAVTNALQMKPTASDEEIRAMVRAVVSQATSEGQSALKEVNNALSQIERLKQELKAAGYPDDLVARVEKQAFVAANQEGQLQYFEKQLQAAGLGKGRRPCWVDPDGEIDFLFDVLLSSEGIRMRENRIQSREVERGTLPIPDTDSGEVLSAAEFTRRTLPLYESSLAKNCRFFVTVFDGTGATEKDLYKSLLRTVEGHFYKRLSSAAAPF